MSVSFLKKLLLRRVSYAITTNEEDKALVEKRGVNMHRIRVIRNGVNVQNPPQRLPEKTVVWSGRMDPVKNLPELLLAWERAAAVLKEHELVLIGDGPEKKRLVELAGTRKIPRVRFAGMVDQKTAFSTVASASCFVLCSFSEGCSNALLEALSFGVPAVVSDIPANRCTVMKTGCALFYSVGDTEMLADEIVGVVSNQVLRAQMSSAALNLVEKEYSFPAIVKQYDDLVNQR